jgi:hypothetical protein
MLAEEIERLTLRRAGVADAETLRSPGLWSRTSGKRH